MSTVVIDVVLVVCGTENGALARFHFPLPMEEDSQAQLCFGEQRTAIALAFEVDREGIAISFPANAIQPLPFLLRFQPERWDEAFDAGNGTLLETSLAQSSLPRRRGQRGNEEDEVRDAILAYALMLRIQGGVSQREAVRKALDYAERKYRIYPDEEAILAQLKYRFGKF